MIIDIQSDSEPKHQSIIIKIIHRLEELFFILIMLLIVICGLLPIGLRYFYSSGVTWTEPLSRQLVLWLALFGAGAATAENKHIAIDVIGHFLPNKSKAILTALISLVSASVCGVMTWISITFVRTEVKYAFPSSISDKLPEWYFELILPIGFFLLTIRMLLFSITTLIDSKRKIKNS